MQSTRLEPSEHSSMAMKKTKANDPRDGGNDEGVECAFVSSDENDGIAIRILKPTSIAGKDDSSVKESREETLVTVVRTQDETDELRVSTCSKTESGKSFSEDPDRSFELTLHRASILKKISKLREQIDLAISDDEKVAFEDCLKLEILSLERKNREQGPYLGTRSKNKSVATPTASIATVTSINTNFATIMENYSNNDDTLVRK